MRAILAFCGVLSLGGCESGATRSPEAAAQQRQRAQAAATSRAREETECGRPEAGLVSEGRAPMMIHYEIRVDACGKIGTYDVYCSGPDCDAERQGRWRARTVEAVQDKPALPEPEPATLEDAP